MKKITYLVLFSLFMFAESIAQNSYDLEFFTQATAPFTIFINGVQQYHNPTKRVRIEGFDGQELTVNVKFVGNRSEITERLSLPGQSSQITYQMRSTRRGVKLIQFSSLPLIGEYSYPSHQDIVVVPYTSVYRISQSNGNNGSQNPNNPNVHMGLNGDRRGGIVINQENHGGYSHQTVSTTTNNTSIVINNPVSNTYIMEGYDGNIGCPWPLQEADFLQAKNIIRKKGFDDTRLGIAKQIIQSNCMFADQIRDLVELMKFEDTKLELAKFAYPYTYDIGNYFKVGQSLRFESSMEELNEYIVNYH